MNAAIPPRPWYAFATPTIGRLVRAAARLTRHGGSAFPGKVVEDIDPGFLARTLGRLPYGVVLVSGTNGKTTTTRMVASMLTELGFSVFTNPTGSNFTRGVVSALLTEVSAGGRLDADIAVLELDEAYAVHFVRQVRPRYALLLNVMRDQLDRFGEIDNTARLLGHVAEATTGTVVLNREDPRIRALADLRPKGTKVRYFGLSEELKSFFPSDDDMATTVAVEGGAAAEAGTTVEAGTVATRDTAKPTASAATGNPDSPDNTDALAVVPASCAGFDADVTLSRVGDHEADFLMDGRVRTAPVRLEGVYNLYNAAAALAVVRAVLADSSRRPTDDELLAAVGHVTPAFGRGEVIDVNGSPVELLLVKNPMGFRLSLASFPPQGADTMIVINDEYADGRDMSWLWDVDFTSLRGSGVAEVSGVRAWDMATRLGYDQVPVGHVEPDVEAALRSFVAANPGRPKHIYCTYTAMLRVRAELAKVARVADAGVGGM
ncbi:Mur ligase family protein [Bifidobacterium avesanii]|uniref:Lipid II isoglutaminyl synthase (glutamine-hydrolyzing) subunit MurT n=1 Tax=Bifidobacterium avesanii TaxID=1798157 RepID=A0A7K3TKW7_9BIFI|nr:Mur ligase family protein [Bifidobacterium avesanii]KAB8290955.1 glutamate ligase [Bifidobacterium avesanii]NEG78913.1 DUF1727 domain-containing protein [Bifidobacterium avesanii]